jgi:hypothetical protein
MPGKLSPRCAVVDADCNVTNDPLRAKNADEMSHEVEPSTAIPAAFLDELSVNTVRFLSVIERIGDLLNYDLAALLSPVRAVDIK